MAPPARRAESWICLTTGLAGGDHFSGSYKSRSRQCNYMFAFNFRSHSFGGFLVSLYSYDKALATLTNLARFSQRGTSHRGARGENKAGPEPDRSQKKPRWQTLEQTNGRRGDGEFARAAVNYFGQPS